MNHQKTIVITGASSGIGQALAVHYAAPDVFLSISGRDENRLLDVAALCRARGAAVDIKVIDVTDRNAMREWIQTLDNVRSIDLVIANAGISGGTGGAGEDEDQIRAIFDVNLYGVLNTIMPCLPSMTARGSGQIAIMASLAGFNGWPGAPAYGASKAAVRIYGEALRGSLADNGVKVSVICPGFVESRMTAVNDYAMPFMMPSDRAAAIIARGLAENHGRIAFPWQSRLLVSIISHLPLGLAHRLLRKMPEKPSSKTA